MLEDNIEARLTLASLLLEEAKEDEAISLLAPPKNLDSIELPPEKSKPWWLNEKVKLKLCNIYRAKAMVEDFVDTIFPLVRESLYVEIHHPKVPVKPRLTRKELAKRAKVLDDLETESVFHGFRPLVHPSDLPFATISILRHDCCGGTPRREHVPHLPLVLEQTRQVKPGQHGQDELEGRPGEIFVEPRDVCHSWDGDPSIWVGDKQLGIKRNQRVGTRTRSRAARARRELQRRKAEALASGADWQSDYSDDDSLQEIHRESPLPNLLKDEEHHRLIIDLCKSLASLQRYWEALEIINLTLRLAHNMLSVEKEEELRSLGAQIAYNTTDPKHGFDCVKYIVQQHPYSLAAWNCYYKVISRVENRDSRHFKFLRGMLSKLQDCAPPIIIYAHQFTMASNHQHAARKYLEAYKLLPENPLINLCVGTALINLALGFRLQNKHQCLAQGLAFLYNNFRLRGNSQLHIMKKCLQFVRKITQIPKLPCENPDIVENLKPGYCDIRREAAYNLHLIYKKSGALDLARQVLKDHCTI
uniref:Uncharacterized protein n=1 Tax=Fagus sylvatica TaxID=28930 RepID=A0A2N9IEC6_FAGSY